MMGCVSDTVKSTRTRFTSAADDTSSETPRSTLTFQSFRLRASEMNLPAFSMVAYLMYLPSPSSVYSVPSSKASITMLPVSNRFCMPGSKISSVSLFSSATFSL